ncbi:hypothetical protein BTO17_07730 [Polaribacter reichenbachii]|nr:hypothetical protein BTO17_07730 [Polaribacter reichenbachii]
MCIILLSITSIYPSNFSAEKKIKLTIDKNSFLVNHQLNWKNTNHFNTSSYWQEQKIATLHNDSAITISNKMITTSKHNPYQYKNVENNKFGGVKITDLNNTTNKKFNRTDTINYSNIDNNGGISSAEIMATVTPKIDLPTAATDAIAVDEDNSNNRTNILKNDSFGSDALY